MNRAFATAARWLCWLPLCGCSVLITPEQEVKCRIEEGRDPCPEGSVCREGRCRPEACGSEELCGDGVDNDCDGMVDETVQDRCGDRIDNDCDDKIDEGHDADGDGVPWCGDLSSPASADCDDLNAKIAPSGPEVCDGLDNDCDDRTDEAPSAAALCGEGKLCVRGQCVAPSCATSPDQPCGEGQVCVDGQCVATGCTPTSCEVGTRCDSASGLCVREQQSENGQTCTRASDCRSGNCADGATMRYPGNQKICVQSCCADSDCPEAQLCIASGTGARSCLPREAFQGLGQQCTNQCAAGQQCAIGVYPTTPLSTNIAPYITSVCVPNNAGQPLSAACLFDSDCASRLCVPSDGSTFWGFCSTPCGSSSDCDAFVPRAPFSMPERPVPDTYCRFVRAAYVVDGSNSNDSLSVCVISRGEVGAGGIGAPCRSGSSCQDGACVGATGTSAGVCAPTCCKDSQCRTVSSPVARCLPVPRGSGSYEMRCIDAER